MSEKKLAWEHPCPQCGGPLWPVTNDSGYLNSEQFDSVKCGDAYCATCKDPRTRSGYRYFWARDFAAPPPEERAPYRIWPEQMPFRKNGTPVVGTMGSRSHRVVIMTAETFQRLIAEHPSLATAKFEVAEYD